MATQEPRCALEEKVLTERLSATASPVAGE